VLHNSAPDLDAEGHPVLRIRAGEDMVNVGVAGSNIFATGAPEQSGIGFSSRSKPIRAAESSRRLI